MNKLQNHKKKEQTKSTTFQSKDSGDKININETYTTKNSKKSQISQVSQLCSKIFGNTPEKESSEHLKKIIQPNKFEKFKIKKSINNLFWNQKDKNDNSNSSLPEYPNSHQLKSSLKNILIPEFKKKEQNSDSVILDIHKKKKNPFNSEIPTIEFKLKKIISESKPKIKCNLFI